MGRAFNQWWKSGLASWFHLSGMRLDICCLTALPVFSYCPISCYPFFWLAVVSFLWFKSSFLGKYFTGSLKRPITKRNTTGWMLQLPILMWVDWKWLTTPWSPCFRKSLNAWKPRAGKVTDHLNLLIYFTPSNEPIIKPRGMKSSICVLIGYYIEISHIHTLTKLQQSLFTMLYRLK